MFYVFMYILCIYVYIKALYVVKRHQIMQLSTTIRFYDFICKHQLSIYCKRSKT